MMLTACHLGPASYRDCLRLQESLVRARAAGETGDWLLFPEHSPLYTVGRGAAPGGLRVGHEVLERMGAELFEVSRGGDITWHGPGQLVGYTVFGLDALGRDLHRLLRGLEDALIGALGRYGIEGRRWSGRTGVWVGEAKIASIGIAVRRWVSYHGFALNVAPDLAYFDVIHPCGLRGIQMTSLAALLGREAPSLGEVRGVVADEVARRFGYPGLVWAAAEAAWRFTAEAPADESLAKAAGEGT